MESSDRTVGRGPSKSQIKRLYKSLLPSRKYYNRSETTWQKINIQTPRPSRPLQPANYMNVDHHMAFQLTAIADEVAFYKAKAEALEKLTCDVIIVPIAFWRPQDNDLDVYGIKADKCPTQIVVAHVPSESTKSLMPEPGTPVTFHFDFDQVFRDFPEVDDPPHWDEDRLQRLTYAIEESRSMASCDERRTMDKNQVSGEDEHENPDEVFFDTFYKRADRIFARYASYGNPHDLMKRLVPKKKEKDDQLIATLREFVTFHPEKPGNEEPDDDGKGRAWNGFAIAPVPGYPTEAKFFRLYVPKQWTWPDIYNKPPAAFNYGPFADLRGSPEEIFRKIGEQPSGGKATISVHYNLRSLYAEGKGVNMAHGTSKKLTAWLRYICDFKPDDGLPVHNLFKEIRGMSDLQQDFYKKGEHVYGKALEKLKSTIDRRVFVSSPSEATGKSYFTQQIAKAVIEKGIKREETAEPLPPAFRHLINPDSTALDIPRGKVVWLTPSNDQAADWFDRWTSLKLSDGSMPNVVRLYPKRSEVNAMLRREPKTRDKLPTTRTHAFNLLINHVNDTDEHTMYDHEPACDPRSLSSLARAYALANKREAYCMTFLNYLEISDDRRLEDMDGRYAVKAMFRKVINNADVLVATPFAADSITKYCGAFRTDLLVLDEAGRHSEQFCLLAVANWPDAATIFSGNAAQSSPMSVLDEALTKETFAGSGLEFHSTMAKIRKTTILARAEANKATDIVLRNVQ